MLYEPMVQEMHRNAILEAEIDIKSKNLEKRLN